MVLLKIAFDFAFRLCKYAA